MTDDLRDVLVATLGWLSAIGGSLATLILGILALVPSAPFAEQKVTLGVVLIVLSLVGIMALTFGFLGAMTGYVLYYTVLVLSLPLRPCLSKSRRPKKPTEKQLDVYEKV